MQLLISSLFLLLITACGTSQKTSSEIAQITDLDGYETAYFASGCFWCVEANFEKINGVAEVESGYTGGTLANPTYGQVCRGETEHLEAVRVTYDANLVSYEDLVENFWRMIDPTDDGGSFVDRGDTYTSAIFTSNEARLSSACMPSWM